MLVQPTHQPPIEAVIEQSIQLSQACLSQPWEKTDRQFRDQLNTWQQALQDASSHLNTTDGAAFAASLQDLNFCIQKFVQVLKDSNVILLSHTLTDEWIPTLRNLSNTQS